MEYSLASIEIIRCQNCGNEHELCKHCKSKMTISDLAKEACQQCGRPLLEEFLEALEKESE